MTVVSAAVVEADGWTLRVTYAAAAPSVRADFALFAGAGGPETQTEAGARVVATVSGPGFSRSGAQAVGASRSREVVAHEVRPDRYPDWAPGQPTSLQPGPFADAPTFRPLNRPLGEVDEGGGQRSIRLMLHKPVAPGETVTVLFRAGWRPDAAADQVVSATNSSAVALEVPSFRWITVPYEAIRGTPGAPANSTTVDMLASHVLPEGASGVAGIRIIATDGTNRSVASWLSIGTSTRYGDSVRCWTGSVSFEVEGAPGTYLTDGLIALHATVYPWFGAPRHTSSANDPATASPALLHPGANAGQQSVRIEAEQPLMLALDRTGARYGYTTQANPGGGTNPLGHAPSTYYRYACVVVDPAGGRTDNSFAPSRNVAEQVVGLGNTPEEARARALAVPVADRCANLTVAGAMLTRLARGLDNANGFTATKTSAHDGFEIFLLGGATPVAHAWSTLSVLSGATSTETYLNVRGEGIDRTHLVGAASGSHSFGGAWRVRMSGIRFRMRAVAFPVAGSSGILWFDQGVRIEDDNPGSPLSGFGSSPPAASTMRIFATNIEEDLVSTGWHSASGAALLLRSVRSRKGFASPTVVNCVKTGAGTTLLPLGNPAIPAGSTEESRHDIHWWFNDCRGTHAVSGWAFFPVTYTAAADGRLKIVRQNVIGNILEKSGGGSAPAYAIGEINNPELDVRGLIIEHNTIVGDRANHCYNQPNPIDQAGSFTRFNSYAHCRVANNYFDKLVSKHEAMFDSNTSTARAAMGEPASTRGYRGHQVQGWQIYFGHLNEGNVEGWRTYIGSLNGCVPENWGLRSIVSPYPNLGTPTPEGIAWPGFTAPAAVADGGAGFGNYRPMAGSPLLDRATTAQIDADLAGNLRTGASWAAGALEGEPVAPPAAMLDPAGARHAHGAGAAGVGLLLSVVADAARQAVRGLAAALGFTPGGSPTGAAPRTRRVPAEERRARPPLD